MHWAAESARWSNWPGKEFDREGVLGSAGELGEGFLGERLGKNELAGLGKMVVAEAVDKVTLKDAEVA